MTEYSVLPALTDTVTSEGGSSRGEESSKKKPKLMLRDSVTDETEVETAEVGSALRIKRDIDRESTPQIIILLSEWMYRNESDSSAKKAIPKPVRSTRHRSRIHRRKSDPFRREQVRKDFYLPTDLARLIHKFVVKCARKMSEFEVEKLIGIGSFAKVYAIRDKEEAKLIGESKRYTMKVMKKKKLLKTQQIKHTMDELKFYKMIAEESQCPFLVRMHYAFQTDTRLCFILDFYCGGELFFHLRKKRRFSEPAAAVMLAEVTSALIHLHNTLDIVYRDIKPENIILQQDGHCILIDLGLSKQLIDGGLAKTFCGTPEYLAPEIISAKPYGKPIDWWAVGILLYELTVGIPPFYHRNIKEMYEKIMEMALVFPPSSTKFTKDLITRLLDRDVSARLGSKSTDEIRNHPFWIHVIDGDFRDCSDFWTQLSAFQVIPPFQPTFKESDPFVNFDPQFLDQGAILEPLAFDKSIEKQFQDEAEDPFEFF